MFFFGYKTEAILDLWSIEHFVSGICLSSLALVVAKNLLDQDKITTNVKKLYFILICLIAYLWESCEHYLEVGATDNYFITYWFQGVEHWSNRLVADPLLVLLGSYLALANVAALSLARFFSITWLVIHIFIFPHSMFLQEQGLLSSLQLLVNSLANFHPILVILIITYMIFFILKAQQALAASDLKDKL